MFVLSKPWFSMVNISRPVGGAGRIAPKTPWDQL